MDDRFDSDLATTSNGSGKKRRRWRSRFSLGLLALIIVVGYAIMFFAVDHWYKG